MFYGDGYKLSMFSLMREATRVAGKERETLERVIVRVKQSDSELCTPYINLPPQVQGKSKQEKRVIIMLTSGEVSQSKTKFF